MIINDRYTPEGLPRLTFEILEVLNRDYNKRLQEGEDSIADFNKEWLERIQNDNPVYFKMCFSISQKISESTDQLEKEKSGSFLLGLIDGYEALRRQADINNLDDSE